MESHGLRTLCHGLRATAATATQSIIAEPKCEEPTLALPQERA